MDLTHSMPPTTSRLPSSRPQRVSSMTLRALAPGVLNTTMPCSAQRSRGILFTPAPALATASSLLEKVKSCMAALRTSRASASSIFSET